MLNKCKKLAIGRAIALVGLSGMLSLFPVGQAHAADDYSASDISGMLDSVAAKLGVEVDKPASSAAKPEASTKAGPLGDSASARETGGEGKGSAKSVPTSPESKNGAIASEIEKIKNENVALKERVAAMEAKISRLQTKVSSASATPSSSAAPSSEQLSKLEGDVAALKSENAALKADIKAAADHSREMEKNVARLTSVVAKLAQRYIGR